MSLASPVITVLFLLAVAVFFVYASRRGAAMEVERKARLARARRASATVLSTRRGAGAIVRGGHRAPEVVLQLLVDGRPVTARWYVFELGLTKIVDGAKVAVRVDADDPALVYPAGDWAEVPALPRRS